MKKTVLILGVLLFCVQVGYAQTPCEKTFSNARQLFVQKNYNEAKTQFQKVVNNCDSNKEIAQEYIRLCDGYLGLAEQQQKQNRVDKSTIESLNRTISELNDKIRYLEKDSIPDLAELLIKAKGENERLNNENNSLNKEKNDQQQFVDGLEKEKLELFDSLRTLGIELNGYLLEKLSKDNKRRIRTYEGISNDSLMGVFRENVKLVNDIKTPF